MNGYFRPVPLWVVPPVLPRGTTSWDNSFTLESTVFVELANTYVQTWSPSEVHMQQYEHECGAMERTLGNETNFS